MPNFIRIAQAGKILGVSTKTLRRWSKNGKLIPQRSKGGQRYYTYAQIREFQSTRFQEPGFKQSQGSGDPIPDFNAKAETSSIIRSSFSATSFILTWSALFSIMVSAGITGYSILRGNSPRKSAEIIPSEISFSPETQSQSSSVLGATVSAPTFSVNIASVFNNSVDFKNDITAPNVVYSITPGTGVSVSTGQTPTISLSLSSGNGILIDGEKITNTGILSLEAGTGISVDGNKITNTLQPDYTQSGWKRILGLVSLTNPSDLVEIGSLTANTITANSLTTGGLSLDNDLTVASGHSLLPNIDLGSDIGSSSHRFNNLWVANINSNSSQAFSGQTTFSYAPEDSTITQASVLINPTTSSGNGQLLGLSVAGYQKALIDSDGDIILGYSGSTPAPATDYPLTIYGHNGTNVAYTDTSGNAYFAGKVGIGTKNSNYAFEINTNKAYVTKITSSDSSGSLIIDTMVGSKLAYGSQYIIANSGNIGIISGSWPSNYIYFSPSSIEALRILNTGLVGIGTTTPASKLDILGSAGLSPFNVASSSGTSILNVTADGNVGIGTTSPNSLLSVNGTASFSSSVSIGGIGNSSGLTIGENGIIHPANGNITIDSWGSSYGVFLKGGTGIFLQSPGGTERMRILNTGLVGIGTTTPASKLDILGSAGLSPFNVASSSGTSILNVTANGKVGIGTTNPSTMLNLNGSAYMYIKNTDGGSVGHVLKIDADNGQLFDIGKLGVTIGNPAYISTTTNSLYGSFAINTNNLYVSGLNRSIGIGTTTPASKLDILGSAGLSPFNVASSSGTSILNVTADGNVGIGTTTTTKKLNINGETESNILRAGTVYFRSGSDTSYGMAWENGDYIKLSSYGGFRYVTGDGGNGPELMRITTAGNVGIGTIAPTAKLDVAGIIRSTAGLSTFTKAGTISDADFAETAVDGLIAVDSTDNRLYVRSGGAWKYIAFTGGFQIPSDETDGLSTGDFLIPYVESKMSDGAVHGLYASFNSVKGLLFADQNAQIASLSSMLANTQITNSTNDISVLQKLIADIQSVINNLQSAITNFADEFTSKRVHTETICVGTKDNETCIDKNQLDQIIKNMPSPTPTPVAADSTPSALPLVNPSATTETMATISGTMQ